MKKLLLAVATALFIPVSFSQAPTAAESVAGVPVIPRAALFGNPEKTQARLSPDGKYVATASRDAAVKLWDAAEFTLVRSHGHVGLASGVGFTDVAVVV